MRTQVVGLWFQFSRGKYRCQIAPALVLFFLLGSLPVVHHAWGASGSCTNPENPCTGCCNSDNECCDQCCGDICCSTSATCCARWNPDTEEYDYRCCAAGKSCTGGICCDPNEVGCGDTCCDDAWSCCDENGDFTYDDCPECSFWYFGVEYFVCFLCDQTPTDGNSQADACNLCDSDWDDVLDSCYLCDKTPTDANNVNDACYLCDNPTHASDPNDQNDKLNDCYLCDKTPTDANNVNDACMLCDDPYHATDPTNQKSKNNTCYPCKNKIAGTQNDDCYQCDKKKADGTAGEDGKNDTCYGYDTDGNGVKESCCPTFRVELEFDDDFQARSKGSAGIGETGSILATQANGQTMGAVTYTTSDATCVTLTGADWTAGDRNCSAQLCAEADGCKQCKTLTVVEPSGAYQTQCGATININGGGLRGVAVNARTYLLPKNVSFTNIQVGEGAVLSVATGGLHPAFHGINHAPWGPVGVSNGNSNTGCLVEGPNPAGGGCPQPYDYVQSAVPAGTAAGTFDWNIPWEYTIGTKTKEFTRLLHDADWDGTTMTQSKGGITVSGP